MRGYSKVWFPGLSLFGIAFFFLAAEVRADSLSVVPASPLIGPPICKPGFAPPQCTAVPFDTLLDLAFQGNGFAQPAVAKDNIPGHPTIHMPEFANDGYYGNGSSWISNSVNSWLKIDLGQTTAVNRVLFGRDRNGGFDDRDPGQFKIFVALADNIYANGDDSNDGIEYIQVFDSAAFGFSGFILGAQTLEAAFTPVNARFIKLQVFSLGAAIDEVQVFGVPEPSSLILLSLGLAALVARRRFPARGGA
jgi:hypothetical protein